MPAVLDLPKQVSKQEEFVEKQLASAQQRIRLLDWFSTGLMLLIGLFACLAISLLVDRYVETPAGTGWAALVICLLGAGAYVYWALYRPTRRDINPFYAARQVEQTIPDAKNSVVNYVDLKDEDFVPGSVKTAIGNRAAKDLKNVDLNRAIQRKQILWLGGIALFFFLASVVMAFLPPTRTTLKLIVPKEGNTTVVQGEDVRFEVEIKGRIPAKGEPDAPRVRIWYNPDDPTTYEERPLEPVEGQRSMFALTVPARQVRNGFHYKVLAGNAQTVDFEVKLHIVPQFTGWIIEYEYPEYLGREPRKDSDQNLVGYYNTMVTITALTNRPVKSGEIKIDGVIKTVPGTLLDDNSEAIRFRFPMMKNGHYWVRFTTTEGHTNPDPQRYKISLVDPKPAFLNYDVTYDYPKYLRADPATVNLREPNLEAIRGTKVTIVGNANRPIKQAKLEFPGQDEPIVGVLDPKKPMQAKFVLPSLMQDGQYRVYFSPKTDEKDADARAFNIMVLADEKPKVRIDVPMQEEVAIPANGILSVEGVAVDDVGIDKMNLRLEVVSPAPNKPLAPKPYRNGISFRRETDNSYPTQVDYKDFVELSTLKPEGQAGAGFKVQEGMVIEYWLEAIDNCDVPPGPNIGISQKKRVKILAPIDPADMKKKQDQQQQRAEIEKNQKQHEQKQDQQNREEKRDPKQPPPPKGDQQPPMGQPEEQPGDQDQKGQPQKGKPQKGGKQDPDAQPMKGEAGDDDAVRKQAEEIARELKKDSGAKNEPAPKEDLPMMPKEVDPMTGKAKDPALPKKELPEPKIEPKVNDPQPKDDPQPKSKSDPKPTDKKSGATKDTPKDVVPEGKKEDSGAKKEIMPPPREIDPKTGQPKEPAPKDQNPKENPDPSQPSDPKQLPNPDQFKELADKLKSDNEREKEEAREQLKKMMEQSKKDGSKAEDQQKKNEEHRNKLNEDQKQDFDKAMQDLQKEMQKLNQEERVKKAAEKAKSDDPETAKQGQEELKRELQREQSPGDVEHQLQHLANNETGEKKKKLEDAEQLVRKNREEQEKKKAEAKNEPAKKEQGKDDLTKKDSKEDPPAPKKEETPADRLAKKTKNKSNEQEKKESREELENQLRDPKQRDQAERDVKDAREKLPDDQSKKEFDDQVKQARENAQKKAEEIQKFADKLNSDKKEERDEAQRQLEESLKNADDKNPKAREQAQKELEQIRDNIKDEAKKDKFDKALKDIDKAVEQHREEQKGKAEEQAKKDAEQIANDLNSKDEGKQKAAQDKLNDMVKDPKKRDAIQKEMEKQRDKASDEDKKQNIDKALADARDNAGPKKERPKGGEDGKVDPKDAEQIANGLNSKDEKKQKAAQDKLNEMMKDPKKAEAIQKEMEKQRDKASTDEEKQNIDKALADARDNAKEAKKDIAKGGDKVDPKKEPAKGTEGKKTDPEIEQLGEDLKSGNPVTEQAAKDKLEEKLKDPKTDATAKKDIEKMLDDHKKSQTAKKAPSKPDPKEAEDLLKKLNSKDPKDAAEAAKKIDEMLKDPAKREALQKQIDEMMKDPKKAEEAKKNIEDLMKKQIDQVADKMHKGSDEERKKAAEDLEEMLKDPKNREFIEKQLENFKKNMDEQARKDFEKKLKEMLAKAKEKDKDKEGGKGGDVTLHKGKKPGENSPNEAAPGSLPDLKNKHKAGELLLEDFKKANEEAKKKLMEKNKWNENDWNDFLKRYEKSLAALKKQIDALENGESIERVKGKSGLDNEVFRSKDGKDGEGINAGGKPKPPPGFEDPYNRFNREISGSQPDMPKK